jgi:sugar phosphate isomerase/epimerase
MAPALAFARTESPIAGLRAGFKLGVASYSLRKFSRADTIRMTQELGIDYINIKSFHIRHEDSPEERKAYRKEFEDAGLTIVGGGTITMHEDTDESVRANFAYARDCGMPLIVIAPKPEVLPRIERFVKEYDIKVAIHNHGPEDEYFPGPRDVLAAVKGMDPRVGCCVDVGHTARTGVDVVEALAMAGDRVLDMHMKDLADMAERDSQVAVGEGNMPVADIFKQLQKMNYDGFVNLEYEINADDPLPGMKQSFAYMHGVLAGLESA